MKTSEPGIAMIKHFESLKLETYLDGGGVPTIGWGHTGPDVKLGKKITEAEAERLLRADLVRFEAAVAKSATKAMNQAQFDACVSLALNIGAGAFSASTLIGKFNSNDQHGASNQFLRWCLDNGKVEPGLAIRRMAERLCFLGRDWRAVI